MGTAITAITVLFYTSEPYTLQIKDKRSTELGLVAMMSHHFNHTVINHTIYYRSLMRLNSSSDDVAI